VIADLANGSNLVGQQAPPPWRVPQTRRPDPLTFRAVRVAQAPHDRGLPAVDDSRRPDHRRAPGALQPWPPRVDQRRRQPVCADPTTVRFSAQSATSASAAPTPFNANAPPPGN